MKPTYKPMGLLSMKPRYFADAADDSVKELKKQEEWENYANKVSTEKPVIVEFFAK